MLLFFPYNTDAPIYHRPVGTIGLIIANVLIHIAKMMTPEELVDRWILSFHTINPIQWLTASFLHLDLSHIIGNMFFLWAFGLVVEGKLGWKKFLPLYLGTAILEGAITQVFVLLFIETASPGALGASGVIYSLIAMSLLWAPNNHIQFIFGFFWRIGLNSHTSIPFAIHTVFFFYIAFDVTEVIMGGLSSGFLHSIGVFTGLMVGVPMLMLGYVDCEGGDILSAVTGKKFEKPTTASELAEQKRIAEERKRLKEEAINNATDFVKNLLSNGYPTEAFQRYEKLLVQFPDLNLNTSLLLKISQGLIAKKNYESVLLITKKYFDHYNPLEKNFAAIFAGTAYIKTKSPKSALRMIHQMSPNLADEKTKKAAYKLKQAAKNLLKEGELEIEGI